MRFLPLDDTGEPFSRLGLLLRRGLLDLSARSTARSLLGGDLDRLQKQTVDKFRKIS